MRLNRLLTSTGAALLLASGLATQANAGAINVNFTINDALNPSDQTVSGDGLSTTQMTYNLPAPFAGSDLIIQGFRTGNDDGLIRLTRDGGTVASPGNGIGVCSDTFRGFCTDQDTVDGFDRDETVRFTITPTIAFAVRTVTFGQTFGNDEVLMRFSTSLGDDVEFSLSENGDNGYRTCDDGICVVDIYKLVASLPTNSLDFNPLTDYTLGQDDIFNYLASTSGFEFAAIDNTDNWYIRGAQWVVADPITNGVPEPASMTLLGAGIMGLGYLNRRRKAA